MASEARPWHHSVPAFRKADFQELGPISAVEVHHSALRKAEQARKSASGQGLLLLVLWKDTAGGAAAAHLPPEALWRSGRQPISSGSPWAFGSCVDYRDVEKGGQSSPGDLSAVPGTTDFSWFWILIHKGARYYQKIGFDRPLLPPAVDFWVLLLMCGELCHRRPGFFIQETLHLPLASQSSKKCTIYLLTHRLHPECYTPGYGCQDVFNVTMTFQKPPPECPSTLLTLLL